MATLECFLNTLLTIPQLRGRYFSKSFVLYVGAEVAAALEHAHTRTDDAGSSLGIVNRDISPGCIRLRPGGGVVLTDFGVETALIGGSEALEERNLLEDEGGIVPASPPRSQDAIRTKPCPLRSADETTTEPGPGACHGINSRRLDAADLPPCVAARGLRVPG